MNLTPQQRGFFMNYLSHHFFYAEEDSWHNTGLILPDWSRSAPGRRQLRWEHHPEAEPKHLELWEGCRKHYEADGWFHDCDYFTRSSNRIEEDLVQLQAKGLMQGQRKWFLAHLLAEMLLDRVIMDKHPQALDHFYEDLNQVPYADIESFLLAAGKEDMGRFPQGHEGFIKSEFIRHYASDLGIAESLNRVAQRVGQKAFSEDDIKGLVAIIPNWIDFASQQKKPHQMARLSNSNF